MTSTTRVTSQQNSKVRVTWSDAIPNTTSHNGTAGTPPGALQTSHKQQQGNLSVTVASPWPTTSCANSVSKDSRYVTITPSTTTVTTQAAGHARRAAGKPAGRSTADDSDSDAQIDSLSSSDLEHCEELDNEFPPPSGASDELSNMSEVCEFSPSLTPSSALGEDVPASSSVLSHSVPDPHLATSPSPALSSSVSAVESPSSSLDTGGVGDSSPRDTGSSGDHVMSLKDFESLPPLWEDGGTRVAGADDVTASSWLFGGEDSVQVFQETWEGPAQDTENRDTVSLEEREEDIEQTLRDIYQSPFTELHHNITSKPPRPQTLPVTPDKHHKFTNGRVRIADYTLDAHPAAGQDSHVYEDESKGKDEMDDPCPRGPVEEYTPSLARVAERAVSGYRNCDDVDTYVSTRQPKLILSRAPPSPSGILRRNNRKAATAKGPPSGVRFADVRATKARFADDVT